MRRRLAVLLLILILMVAGNAFGEEKIKIGYMPIGMSLPTFVAAEKGLFEQEGLKVEITPFESSTLIIGALIAGRIDADCSSGTPGTWLSFWSINKYRTRRVR
jgi:ABC-type nitrate/sulfonate/bicarbonate transport system substrate-binding protein